MQVLAVAGPSDSGKTTLVESLVGRLSERGRVATVKHLRTEPTVDTEGKDTHRHRAAGADATYGVTDDAGWFATGRERSLDETLDHLAADYEYAIVEGYSSADLPTVALGGRDHAGETVATAPEADALDPDTLVDAVEALEPYETLGSLVAEVKRSPDARYAGAIATFTGRVRQQEDADRAEFLDGELDLAGVKADDDAEQCHRVEHGDDGGTESRPAVVGNFLAGRLGFPLAEHRVLIPALAREDQAHPRLVELPQVDTDRVDDALVPGGHSTGFATTQNKFSFRCRVWLPVTLCL